MERRMRPWLLLLGGICLVVAGFLTLRQQALEEGKAIGRVLGAYTTVNNPNNPPRMEIEEQRWWFGGRTNFDGVGGGTITLHLPPGFDWKKAEDEIRARFAWIGWIGYALLGLGGAALLGGTLGLLMSAIRALASLMKPRV